MKKRLSHAKIIGVDIDNIISDTDSVIRKLIEIEYGIKSSRGEIINWRYSESIPISIEQEKTIFQLFHEQYCLEALPIPFSSESLKTLSKTCLIWLLTFRPQETNSLTVQWLKQYNITYDVLIHSSNKTEFCDRIDCLIEDNGKTAISFAENGIPVILFDSPWNSEYSHSLIFRVNNWLQALKLLDSEQSESSFLLNPHLSNSHN